VYRSIAWIITLVFALSACTSCKACHACRAGKTPAVKVGEQVEVTNKKGETLKFRVTALEPGPRWSGKNRSRAVHGQQHPRKVERPIPARTGVTVGLCCGDPDGCSC